MSISDLQRWSRDVAEDPASPSFLPLARAYRRQGRRDAARALVLRGLERNPEHVDAHALLALLHVDAGERERAGDEWEMILRLDPENFDARRGLGFLALERGELPRARRHLEAARNARPGDPTVDQALQVLVRREVPRSGDGVRAGTPARATPAADGSANTGGAPRGATAPTARSVAPGPSPSSDGAVDPARIFEPLAREAPFLGALLLDRSGLVLAGGLSAAATGDGEALGALLSPAIDEAVRTADLLELGGWQGVMLDCEGAVLHLAPVAEGVLVVAARQGAPAGWVVRTASRARALALRFLEDDT